ncbi:MAG: transcriptional regulator NrdR [Syntrophomonadaceae bacterium]|nr:transcriptional regulator NrdR [Syntrophomonadaceae bacterium]
MRCPYCNHHDSRVLDSRPAEEGSIIRRRRECQGCSRRFTTYERVEEVPLIVVKRDGRRELFDRNKLLRGVIKAFDKRSISLPQMEKLVDEVEKELRNQMEAEITAEEIGERVMEKLRLVDEVAFVRFASVYRRFTDAQRFVQEVQNLLKNNF